MPGLLEYPAGNGTVRGRPFVDADGIGHPETPKRTMKVPQLGFTTDIVFIGLARYCDSNWLKRWWAIVVES